ncbi:MAG TPA: cytochrome c [Planctomycetaceae bacterium]|nr:cytochrome c [Planctomycetaceae bacterium]
MLKWIGLFLFAFFCCLTSNVTATEPGDPAEGWRILREFPFLVPDFDDEVLDQLWTVWPDERRNVAEQASPEERRRMTFELYGLQPLSADDQAFEKGLGYVRSSQGDWVMNCLGCHGGQVAGRVIPGLGNADFDMESLAEDVRAVKKKLGKPLTHLDGSIGKTLLSSGPGLTNAVNFGVDLGAIRDDEMNVHLDYPVPDVPDYGMDAPPFWNVKYKQRLYCDNHAPNYHRVLMQFILHPWNNASYVKRQEDKFRDIQAWMMSLESPPSPLETDPALVERGRIVFQKTCAECHGTYENGKLVDYPERVIPIEELKTDPVRLEQLRPEYRGKLKKSWLTEKDNEPGEHYEVISDAKGYVAPPLKGIWASAPYFHNGSVPTLWNVLHSEERPKIWKRVGREYDETRVGHAIEEFESLPADFSSLDKYERRRYFNSSDFGKQTGGHTFPEVLSEEEKREVLEYLKTL